MRDAFLHALGTLVPLAPDEREALGARMHVQSLARGEAWLREGDRCEGVAFVARGTLRIYFLSDGDDVTAYFASENQTVSDYESFLTREPARQTIEAVEDADLVTLDRDSIEWAFATLEHGERLGRLIAERLFLATHRRLAAFYLENAEERYTRLLDEHPGLIQRVPQHMIAAYVGVRPPSLSRIRKRLASGD